MDKKKLGLVLGVAVAIIIQFMNIPGLEPAGQACLALTMMTVFFWAFQVAQSGFTSGLYLVLLIIFGVADPATVFYSWTGSTMYLVIGAYLIANAVNSSGLGNGSPITLF